MLQYIREARRSESGFTLIELLMVIVILGILSGIVVFAVGGITDRGQAAACKADGKTVTVAEEAYFASPTAGNGSYGTMAQLVSGGFLHAPSALVGVSAPAPGATYTLSAIGKCSAPTAYPVE